MYDLILHACVMEFAFVMSFGYLEKLWTESEEGRAEATHTHKGERGQRSPPTRER